MKEINMTKAISCMPDKFITMEMVELAATEHRPNWSTICRKNILLLKYLTVYSKQMITDGIPGNFRRYLKKNVTARFV